MQRLLSSNNLFICWLLLWFEAISIENKSNQNDPVQHAVGGYLDELSITLGCKLGELPTGYFGSTLSTPHHSFIT